MTSTSSSMPSGVSPPPVPEEVVRRAFVRFAAAYPGSLPDEAALAARAALWQELLDTHPWISRDVFERAMWWTLWHVEGFLPDPAAFLRICEQARDDLAREAGRVPALPAPEARVVDTGTGEVDPADPYSCTADERDRWAREDAGIRTWAAARAAPVAEEVLARLRPEDRQREAAARQATERLARWPQRTPAARRATERRIERARQAALAEVRQHLERGRGMSRLGVAAALERLVAATAPGGHDPRS